MELIELVKKNRSYRRFDQSYQISTEVLHKFISLAQYSASARNDQPLKFWLSNTPEMNAIIFSNLSWAGALKDWPGPKKGEQPSAYILILGDREICENFGIDHGIAAQSILLGAAQIGLGGCIIGSINREELQKALEIPERFQLLLAIALGKPAETVLIKIIDENATTTYYRDEIDNHIVPKRKVEDLILHDV